MAAPAISNANAIARAVPRTTAARNNFDGPANFQNKCQLVMELNNWAPKKRWIKQKQQQYEVYSFLNRL